MVHACQCHWRRKISRFSKFLVKQSWELGTEQCQISTQIILIQLLIFTYNFSFSRTIQINKYFKLPHFSTMSPYFFPSRGWINYVIVWRSQEITKKKKEFQQYNKLHKIFKMIWNAHNNSHKNQKTPNE